MLHIQMLATTMRLISVLIVSLFCANLSAIDLERGIKLGMSCVEIESIERDFELNDVEYIEDSAIVFVETLHNGSPATVLYSCLNDRWAQRIQFGHFSQEEAISAFRNTIPEIELRYGKAIHNYQRMSYLKKLWTYISLIGEDPRIISDYKNSAKWEFEDFEILLHVSESTGNMTPKGTWQVNLELFKPRILNICGNSDCQPVRY